MLFVIQVLQIIFYFVGIIFMLTLTFLSIWGFVLYHKNSASFRINNYVLEKIYHSLNKVIYKNNSLNENIDFDLESDDDSK